MGFWSSDDAYPVGRPESTPDPLTPRELAGIPFCMWRHIRAYPSCADRTTYNRSKCPTSAPQTRGRDRRWVSAPICQNYP